MLNLSRSNLGVPGVHALGGLFTSNWNTLYLYLSNANINAEAVVAFAISSEPSFDCTLKLNHNPLGYVAC